MARFQNGKRRSPDSERIRVISPDGEVHELDIEEQHRHDRATRREARLAEGHDTTREPNITAGSKKERRRRDRREGKSLVRNWQELLEVEEL